VITRLSKLGKDLGVVIDQSLLDRLGIDEDTRLDVSTDGDVIIVAPVRDEHRRRQFEQALASTNRRYGRTLKRLAE